MWLIFCDIDMKKTIYLHEQRLKFSCELFSRYTLDFIFPLAVINKFTSCIKIT